MTKPLLASLLLPLLRCGAALVARGPAVEGAFVAVSRAALAAPMQSQSPLLPRSLLPSSSSSSAPHAKAAAPGGIPRPAAVVPTPQPPPPLPLFDVLYRTSVVPHKDFLTIQQQASLLLLSGRGRRCGDSSGLLCDETSSVAVGRQGMTLDRSGRLVQILDLHVAEMLRKRTGREYLLCDDDDVPAELRVYQRRGAAMAWHRDDVLYDPPQVEVLFTVENTSNCATRWKKKVGPGQEEEEEEASVETDPNSALVLAAGGPWHCVTSLTRGRRVIVKLAYILPGAQRRVGPSPSREGTAKRHRRK